MLSLKIAVRFLKSSKAQTMLIVLGIAVGVSVQVFVGSLIGSLQKTLVNNTVGTSPQITVTSATDDPEISGWQALVDRIGQVSSVTAISVAVDSPGFANVGNKTSPILVRGFQITEADKIYKITDAIYAGRAPEAAGEVLVGKNLNDKLALSLGQQFDISTSNGSMHGVVITGFYDLKVSSINERWVITTLDTAQDIFALGSSLTSIEMKVKDVFKADVVANEIQTAIGNSTLRVDNWKVQNESLLSGLQGQTISSLMIQIFVLAAVVIAIASILAIKVVQKSRQLGILKAMGIKDRTASLIFLLEGFMLGVGGSIAGVSLGLFLLYGFGSFATNPDGSPIITLYLDYKFVLASGIIAVLAATVAAVVPARRSSRLSPIEVIKNG